MKNKKLIRLTESDLHRIVRESVNNVLTELNWKTKMSAANKLDKKALSIPQHDERLKMHRRANKIRQSAYDSFNDEYGYEDDEYKYYVGGGSKGTSDVTSFTSNKNRLGQYAFPYGLGKKHFISEPYRDSRDYEELKKNKNAYDAMIKGDNEMYAYLNGDYDYDSIEDGGEGKWIKKR